MDIRQVLKRSDTVTGLMRDFRKVVRLAGCVGREKNIKKYFASQNIRKLHIGAGSTKLDNWLSTDIDILSDDIIYLDATKVFPFSSNLFDYVYSEHMIEHLCFQDGLMMMKECIRVLKPGGIMRIATPDLEVILNLYSDHDQNSLKQEYIKWITDTFITGISYYKSAIVTNNAFRNWGHQFLYDGELMEMAMSESGFTNIKRYPYNESDDEHLRGIECHGKNVDNAAMVTFETMIYEGKCPL